MVERILSFSDPDAGAYGAVAIAGERGAAYLGGGERSAALSDCAISRGEGALRLSGGEAGEYVLGFASGTSPLGFDTGTDVAVTVQAIGVSGDLPGEGGFEGPGVAWTFEGLPGDVGAIRTAWALLGDGTLLVLFALRQRDSGEHGSEQLGAARVAKDGSVRGYAEPLLSTEYDASGAHTRATLELWAEEETVPERGAGLRRAGGAAELGEASLSAAGFEWSVEGVSGAGGYEILSTG